MQASLPELRLWLEFAQNPSTLEECEIRLRENHARFLLRQNLQFEIFDASSDAFLGRIGFPFVNWKVPKFEIGYWLDSKEAGKGYITEAVLALTGLAFAVLGAKRVEIFCNARNSASRRVAEKAGFTLECIQKTLRQTIEIQLERVTPAFTLGFRASKFAP